MRVFCLAACLVLLTGCATTQDWGIQSPDGQAVEDAILWETSLDETWTPIAMAKVVGDSDRFEKEGNFYKVKNDLVVFGHRATYVGMLGVHLTPGPNAVLEGTPKSIASYISRRHGIKFKSVKDIYVCDYKEHIRIIIEKHPGINGSSIIIGAYTGP